MLIYWLVTVAAVQVVPAIRLGVLAVEQFQLNQAQRALYLPAPGHPGQVIDPSPTFYHTGTFSRRPPRPP